MNFWLNISNKIRNVLEHLDILGFLMLTVTHLSSTESELRLVQIHKSMSKITVDVNSHNCAALPVQTPWWRPQPWRGTRWYKQTTTVPRLAQDGEHLGQTIQDYNKLFDLDMKRIHVKTLYVDGSQGIYVGGPPRELSSFIYLQK